MSVSSSISKIRKKAIVLNQVKFNKKNLVFAHISKNVVAIAIVF